MRNVPDKPFVNYGDTLFTIGIPVAKKKQTSKFE